MVVYFLDFQETKESSKNTQNPVVDLLELEQDPQLTSEKALSCKVE